MLLLIFFVDETEPIILMKVEDEFCQLVIIDAIPDLAVDRVRRGPCERVIVDHAHGSV